jgi:hypothetical protein
MKSLSKIQVYLKDGQLLPCTQFDAEQIEEHKQSQTFDLIATGKRSNPHHSLYWATLNNVCKATGKWPTHRHLHDELKWACGYVRMRWNGLANCHMRVIDSISFDDMDQKEFNKYFEMAMEKLSEAIGYDPLHRNP